MIIYKTTNLINGKIYIGQDLYNNSSYLGSGKVLKLSIKKYGEENFRKDILEYCNSKIHMDEREIYWIACFNSIDEKIGYNRSPGGFGGSIKGRKQSPEHIRKKALANTGQKRSEETCRRIGLSKKGVKPSAETLLKLSAVHKGKHISEEHKRRIGEANRINMTGRKLSQETRKKLSEAQKGKGLGKKLSEETKRKISEAQKGREYIPISKEARKKISLSKIGIKCAEETKIKISLANKKAWAIKKGEKNNENLLYLSSQN